MQKLFSMKGKSGLTISVSLAWQAHHKWLFEYRLRFQPRLCKRLVMQAMFSPEQWLGVERVGVACRERRFVELMEGGKMLFNRSIEWNFEKAKMGIYLDSSRFALGAHWEYFGEAFSITILCFTFHVGWGEDWLA